MNDDIEFLRRVFKPYDPAQVAHAAKAPQLSEIVDFTDAVRGDRAPRAGLLSRHLPVVAAAAVAAVVATAGIWAAGRGHPDRSSTRPGTASSRCSPPLPSSQPRPVPAPGFDHLRWQDWSGGRLVDTVNRWISPDGHGRITETDASGQLTRDLTIVPPAASPSGAAPSNSRATASAQATPEPTGGTDQEAVDYPGAVPSDVAAVRCYLAGHSTDPAVLGSGVVGLLFNRALTGPQAADLIAIATSITHQPSTPSTLPTGQKVQLVPIPALVSPAALLWLALNPDRANIVGVCYDQDQQTCRVLILSEHTATTN
jgi:hypothetical protein